jgi:hypothetical protein
MKVGGKGGRGVTYGGGQSLNPSLVFTLYSKEENGTEAEFLDVIGTKVLRVFLLAIHSHLF